MPKPKKGPRLGSGPSHQRLMLSNLAVSLFEHERIQTTEAKAKMLRPYAERLITKAKKGDVHNRRQVLSLIEDRDVVHKLFSEIAPRFSERNGGYTRILKIGPRNGDGAPMALIELVDGESIVRTASDDDDAAARRRRGLRRTRPKKDAAATEPASAEADESGDEEEVEDAPAAETAPEVEAASELEDAPTGEASGDDAAADDDAVSDGAETADGDSPDEPAAAADADEEPDSETK